MEPGQGLEPRTADIQEDNRVDGQESAGRPQVEHELSGLAGGRAPQHRQSVPQPFGANVHRRHQRQVGSDALERTVPEGATQALHLVSRGGVQDKGRPETVPPSRAARAYLRRRHSYRLGRLGGVAQDDDPVVVDLYEAALHLEAKLVGGAVGVDYPQGMGL